MAAKGQSITITYYAWNTSANVYQTGDVANHTLRLLKDGTEAAPTNGASEIDATNTPGLYALALTSAEATFNTVDVAGKSSTSNVVLIGKTYLFDNVPVFAPSTPQGLLTVGSGSGSLTTTSGFAAATMQQWLGLPPNALQSGLVQVAVLSGIVNANVTQVVGTAVTASSGFLQVNTVQVVGVAPTIEADGRLTVATVSGLVNANLTLINGAAAVTSSAQLGVNVVTFAGNAQGVTNIDRSTRSIALATASNASTTTTITLSTITPANLTPSQYVGRIVNFDATTTTANLRGQSTNITASVTSSGGALSVTALTDAPVFGDTFSIT